jgi:hypothetical protein
MRKWWMITAVIVVAAGVIAFDATAGSERLLSASYRPSRLNAAT